MEKHLPPILLPDYHTTRWLSRWGAGGGSTTHKEPTKASPAHSKFLPKSLTLAAISPPLILLANIYLNSKEVELERIMHKILKTACPISQASWTLSLAIEFQWHSYGNNQPVGGGGRGGEQGLGMLRQKQDPRLLLHNNSQLVLTVGIMSS